MARRFFRRGGVKGDASVVMASLTPQGKEKFDQLEEDNAGGAKDILEVLEYLGRMSPASIASIADNTGLSQQKVRSILDGLCKANMAVVTSQG